MRSNKLYAIFDEAGQGYHQPFWAATDEHAERMLAMAMAEPQSQIMAYPSQYSLECVGSFDVVKGEFTPEKRHIGIGTNYVEQAVHLAEKFTRQESA